MIYVDIHSHMDFESLNKNIESIIPQMKEKKIITLSNTLDPENYENTKNKFKNYKDTIKVCPGLYPQDAEKISEKNFKEYLKKIEKEKNEIIAIGEIGMDFHHTTEESKKQLQEKRFREIIELGIKINKPLIIHTRKAEQKVLEILSEYVEKYKFTKFNLHCFMGKKKLIKEIKRLNIYCSIPMIVKNTQSFQILVEELPIRQLLVETDSPFLHPEKITNSPLSVPLIYEEIAKIKGYDINETKNMIYKNYMKLIT